jgi:hypothetical protein
LSEIRRLHKEVNTKSPGKTWLVFDLELTVFGLSIIEWPRIQPSMHERNRTRKVNKRANSERRNRL